MNDIFDLYQELIIDHSRTPKNFGTLEKKSHHAQGYNPLCGDIIDLDLMVENNVIQKISFHGDGCAISRASASLMTESIKKKTVDDALKLFTAFHAMLTKDHNVTEDLGKLKVLHGVKQFPMRVKCATLCWHALNAALISRTKKVSTE
jgi:nitrogen fixation protein NifU and related proteins